MGILSGTPQALHAGLHAWVHLGPFHDAPAAARSSRRAPGALKGKML